MIGLDFGFFGKQKQPLLDEEIILWLFDTYEWALTNFGADVFFKETVLVKPTNEFFGGEENTAEGMANLIFERVKAYAGVTHWPCKLVEEVSITSLSRPQIKIEGSIRGQKAIPQVAAGESDKFVVIYNQFQLNDPEVLIATYAHSLAYYLGLMAPTAPPGGSENLPHATELLAVFMGFGVIMANSANTRKIRSCGSCSGPAVERTNYLSEFDTCYALAIFTQLKGLDNNGVRHSLKKNLRPFFKKAVKDIESREKLYSRLKDWQQQNLTQVNP